MKGKVARLKIPPHTSYQPVLIHAGGAADSIAEQDYFSRILDFGELLTVQTQD